MTLLSTKLCLMFDAPLLTYISAPFDAVGFEQWVQTGVLSLQRYQLTAMR